MGNIVKENCSKRMWKSAVKPRVRTYNGGGGIEATADLLYEIFNLTRLNEKETRHGSKFFRIAETYFFVRRLRMSKTRL